VRLLARAAGAEGPERLPALRAPAPRRRALIALVLAALAVAGCGADDEPAADVPPPAPNLTVPQTDKTETTDPVDPATETLPPETSETAPAPITPTDSPANDTPPPANSPAQRFEDYCNNNPGACG
jgi:hypothetical protein